MFVFLVFSRHPTFVVVGGFDGLKRVLFSSVGVVLVAVVIMAPVVV